MLFYFFLFLHIAQKDYGFFKKTFQFVIAKRNEICYNEGTIIPYRQMILKSTNEKEMSYGKANIGFSL